MQIEYAFPFKRNKYISLSLQLANRVSAVFLASKTPISMHLVQHIILHAIHPNFLPACLNHHTLAPISLSQFPSITIHYIILLPRPILVDPFVEIFSCTQIMRQISATHNVCWSPTLAYLKLSIILDIKYTHTSIGKITQFLPLFRSNLHTSACGVPILHFYIHAPEYVRLGTAAIV